MLVYENELANADKDNTDIIDTISFDIKIQSLLTNITNYSS